MYPSFKFGHDIFAGENSPVITGKVEVEVVRTQLYRFLKESSSWEADETGDKEELYRILSQENAAFQWAEADPKDESAMISRLNSAASNGYVTPDGHSVETTVTLQPGSGFDYGYSWGTDEGYASRGLQCAWNIDGWNITEHSGGRDCDGNHGNTEDYFQKVDGERSRERTEVYDQFARAANY